MNYDFTVIQRKATELYLRASWAVVVWVASGVIAGAYAGLRLQEMVYEGDPRRELVAFIMLSALLLGLLGLVVGRSRELELRFRAQAALCMAEIERNTRRA